ncbi:MAG: hypothetical protein R2873_34020 [Caldilineaceae bacterium]
MSEILIKVGAVLILIVGAVYPLAAMVGMVRRMNQPGMPPMGPMTLMVRLMLIATVPLAGLLGGFAGLLPAVWASFVLRVVILAAAIASVTGFVALFVLNRMEKTQQQITAAKDETGAPLERL